MILRTSMELGRNNIITTLEKVGTLDGIRGTRRPEDITQNPEMKTQALSSTKEANITWKKNREAPLHFPKEPTQTDHQENPPLQTQTTRFAMGRSKEFVKPLQDIKKVQITELPQYANSQH